MEIACAWCGASLREFPAAPDGGRRVSHGICGECARAVLADFGRPLAELLDRFPAPVLAADGDGRLVAANRAAETLLGRSCSELVGLLGGNAFECRYASLPEGCGGTIHCRTCTIRNTVTDTLRTGRAHRSVPAYADLHHASGDRRVLFHITTCRVDTVALLRIDDVADAPAGPSPAEE